MAMTWLLAAVAACVTVVIVAALVYRAWCLWLAREQGIDRAALDAVPVLAERVALLERKAETMRTTVDLLKSGRGR